jgi:xanthine dehydrogenase YagS FAD-binding subunit
MKTFQLIKPKDSAQASAATSKAKTAQQGADIRFIAGGTALIDLMKLNVEQPQNLVDLSPPALTRPATPLPQITGTDPDHGSP